MGSYLIDWVISVCSIHFSSLDIQIIVKFTFQGSHARQRTFRVLD